ncbi:Hsp20 family protein [Clostridium sporogenes]|nr:Hsp20 family protein [Clostridium sporogenes]MBU5300795.1 Hsp20 family protein [Clostridium sporogenes]
MFDMIPFRKNNINKKDSSIENKKENFVRQERYYEEFNKSFYIDNVDENNIEASFEDGVLKINLPKLDKENLNRKRIDIQ